MAAPTRHARSALADALRNARRNAGLTGKALATEIGAGWGQPKVSKIESGRQMPTADDVVAWATATGAPSETMLGLLRRAQHEYETFRDAFRTDGGAVGHQETHFAAEQSASTIFVFHPNIVHGLLQTADYAGRLLRLPGGPGDHGATSEEIDRMVAARMRRAAILYEPGRRVTVLISEAALNNRVGDVRVMQEQLNHIARLTTSTTHATIGIVPFRSFPVLVQQGWDQRDGIVTLETTAGDLEIADPEEVAQYESWGRILLGSATTGKAAAEMCRHAGASYF